MTTLKGQSVIGSVNYRKMRLTFENSGDVPLILATTRTTTAVLIITVAAVMSLCVSTSCFNLVQRPQFRDGLSLQQLVVKKDRKKCIFKKYNLEKKNPYFTEVN